MVLSTCIKWHLVKLVLELNCLIKQYGMKQKYCRSAILTIKFFGEDSN